MRVSPLQVYIFGLLLAILDRWLVSSLSAPSASDIFFRRCNGKHGEFLPHPYDCTRFLRCSHERAYVFQCPMKLRWNQALKTCDWEQKTKCVYDSLDDQQGITVAAGRKAAVKRDTRQQNGKSNKSKEPEPEASATFASTESLYKLKQTSRTTLQPKKEKLVFKLPCTPKIKTSTLALSTDEVQTSTKSDISTERISGSSNYTNDNRESTLNTTIEKDNNNANLTEPLTEITSSNIEVTTVYANSPYRKYLTEMKTKIDDIIGNTPTYVAKGAAEGLTKLLANVNIATEESILDTFMYDSDNSTSSSIDNNTAVVTVTDVTLDIEELPTYVSNITEADNVYVTYVKDHVADTLAPLETFNDMLPEVSEVFTANPANGDRTREDLIDKAENTSKYATVHLPVIPIDVNSLTTKSKQEDVYSSSYFEDDVNASNILTTGISIEVADDLLPIHGSSLTEKSIEKADVSSTAEVFEDSTEILRDVSRKTVGSTEENDGSSIYVTVTDTTKDLTELPTTVKRTTEKSIVENTTDLTEILTDGSSITKKSTKETNNTSTYVSSITKKSSEEPNNTSTYVTSITKKSSEETNNTSNYVQENVAVTLTPYRPSTEKLTDNNDDFTELPTLAIILTDKSEMAANFNSTAEGSTEEADNSYSTYKTITEILTVVKEDLAEDSADVSSITEKSADDTSSFITGDVTETLAPYKTITEMLTGVPKGLAEVPANVNSNIENSTDVTDDIFTNVKHAVIEELAHQRTSATMITEVTKDFIAKLTDVKITTDELTKTKNNIDLAELTINVISTYKELTEAATETSLSVNTDTEKLTGDAKDLTDTSTYVTDQSTQSSPLYRTTTSPHVTKTLTGTPTASSITLEKSTSGTDGTSCTNQDLADSATDSKISVNTDIAMLTSDAKYPTEVSIYVTGDSTESSSVYTRTTASPHVTEGLTGTPTASSTTLEKSTSGTSITNQNVTEATAETNIPITTGTEMLTADDKYPTDISTYVTDDSTESSSVYNRTTTSPVVTEGLTDISTANSTAVEQSTSSQDDTSTYVTDGFTDSTRYYRSITEISDSYAQDNVNTATEKLTDGNYINTNGLIESLPDLRTTTEMLTASNYDVTADGTSTSIAHESTESSIIYITTATDMLTDSSADLTKTTLVPRETTESPILYTNTATYMLRDGSEGLTGTIFTGDDNINDILKYNSNDLTQTAVKVVNTADDAANTLTESSIYVNNDITKDYSTFADTSSVGTEESTPTTYNSFTIKLHEAVAETSSDRKEDVSKTANTVRPVEVAKTQNVVPVTNLFTDINTTTKDFLTDTTTTNVMMTESNMQVNVKTTVLRDDLTAMLEQEQYTTESEDSTVNFDEMEIITEASEIKELRVSADNVNSGKEHTATDMDSKTDLNLATTNVAYVSDANANGNANNIKDPKINDAEMLMTFTNKPSSMLTNEDFENVEQAGILDVIPSTVETLRENKIALNEKHSNTFTLSSTTMSPFLDDISSTLDPRLPYRARQCQGDGNRRQFPALKCYQYYQCFAGWAFLLNCEDGYLFGATDGKCLVDTKSECKE